MVKKDSPTPKENKNLAVYEIPKVTTYSEADIIDDLGEMNASDALNPLYFSVEL